MEFEKFIILAIDDDFDNLIIIKSLIQDIFINADVLLANSGREGVDIAKSSLPDIILLDADMPDMDGFEVCRFLKSNKELKEIPVVFITALSADKSSKIKGLEVGADAFLDYPIDESELIAQVRAMLKIRIANRERQGETHLLAVEIEERTQELKRTHVATMNLLEDLKNENDARKKSEAALRESEEKYRELANFLPQSVFEIDAERRITYLNEQSYLMLGYDPEDNLIGRNTLEFHVPEEFERINLNFEKLKAGIHMGGDEYKIVRKDGATFPGLVYMNIIWQDGECVGARGILVDISNQKKAEERIRESERKYRLITEKITDVVWIMDLKGKSLFVSQSIEKFTGFTVDEYLKQTVNDRFTPESAKRALVILTQEVEDYYMNRGNKRNLSQNLVLEYLCKDGTTKFGELLVSPYLNEQNQFVGLHGVTRDITRRTKAERKLLESEALYRAIIDASPDYILITDLDGVILKVSPSAAYKYGYSDVNDLIGKNVSIFIKPSDKNRMRKDLSDLIKGKKLGPNEYGSITANGSVFDIEVKGGLISEADGKLIRMVFIARDITERKLARLALEKSEARYRDYVENSPDAIAIYTDGLVSYVNQECLRLMRASTKEQLIGRPIYEFIHPDNREFVLERIKAVNTEIANGTLPLAEEKYIRLDGTAIYVEVKAMPLMIDGKLSIQLTARDITERKLTREALEESENRYNTFINNNVDMIFVKDDQFRYLIANEALAKYYGKTTNELYGKTDKELAKESLIFPGVSSDKKALTVTSAFLIEESLGDKVYEAIKFPMQLKGNKKGIGGIIRDITVRKHIEQALERSRTELKTIYDNAPIMMCLVDEQRHILFSNNPFAELIDGSQSEFAISKIGNIIGCVNAFTHLDGCGAGDECRRCGLRAAINNTFKTGKGHQNIDYVYRTKRNNEPVEYSLLCSTALIDNGGTNNLLLCLSDITDRKLTEEALQKSEMILRTFIDNVPFEIWARDINGIGILENNKMKERFGSIINKRPEQLNTKKSNQNDSLFRSYRRAFDGDIVNEEIEYVVDSQIKIFQQIIFPIFNKTIVNGIAGINIDITQRKEFEKALRESQVQIKKFAAHLQDVREEEKVLLAREIHDELGQILIALKIDMGMLRQNVLKTIDPQRLEFVSAEFNDILKLIDNTIKSARRIMTDLRPELLEMLGFSDAVKFHAKSFQERLNVKCSYVNKIKNLQLTSQQSVALFRIVQEALNNVAKHSRATEVKIEIHNENDIFILEISDNGIGFVEKEQNDQESYGLIGMKERVFLLDGELTITSHKNKGTYIRIVMPLKSELFN